MEMDDPVLAQVGLRSYTYMRLALLLPSVVVFRFFLQALQMSMGEDTTLDDDDLLAKVVW